MQSPFAVALFSLIASVLTWGMAAGLSLPDPAVGDTTLGDDTLWGGEFDVPGPMGSVGRASGDDVEAIAVYNGKLVVAGEFGFMDGVAAPGIASWDGNHWTPFSRAFPLQNPPDAMVQFRDKLIAGAFSSSSTGPLYAWDGNDWNPVPLPATEMEYQGIRRLTLFQGDLIVCGIQSSLNDTLYVANPILLKWDGGSWQDMTANIRGSLYDVVAIGDSLYIAGSFSLAPDTSQVNVASWNGTTWSAVGGGTSGPVYSLATIDNGRLVAAGHFSSAGSSVVPSVAILNNNHWEALGTGFDGLDGAHVYLHVTAPFQGSLMVSGFFDTTGTGISTNFQTLALWDGSIWTPLGNEPRGDRPYYSQHALMMNSLVTFRDRLIGAGRFWQSGRFTSGNLAVWDGSEWAPLVPQPIQLAEPPECFLPTETGLLAAGKFALSEDYGSTFGVARWDGRHWTLLGTGMNDDVRALALYEGHVIAAGDFTSADGAIANHIAEWDGNAWKALGQGTDDIVTSLDVFSHKLIAGGVFRRAGGQAANRIAAWDGYGWSPLGGGLSGLGVIYVSDLAVFQGGLIACGNFTWADELPAHYIARWNGTVWKPLSPEVSIEALRITRIDEMAVWNNQLIARSYFFKDLQNSENEPPLAAWDGSKWSFLDHLPQGGVTKLGVYDGRLLIGGWFYDDLKGFDQSYAFLYDGTYVLRMGHGVWSGTMGLFEGPSLNAVATWEGRLYLGGMFMVAGQNPSFRMAAWNGHRFQAATEPFALLVSPNPVRSTATLNWALKTSGHVRLRIIDLQGREVARLIDDVQAAGPAGYVWDVKDNAGFRVAPGVYFFRLSTDDGNSTRKIVITP